jgi:hypothetical protein
VARQDAEFRVHLYREIGYSLVIRPEPCKSVSRAHLWRR